MFKQSCTSCSCGNYHIEVSNNVARSGRCSGAQELVHVEAEPSSWWNFKHQRGDFLRPNLLAPVKLSGDWSNFIDVVVVEDPLLTALWLWWMVRSSFTLLAVLAGGGRLSKPAATKHINTNIFLICMRPITARSQTVSGHVPRIWEFARPPGPITHRKHSWTFYETPTSP